ncbi:ATP-binding protein [Streptomyces flavidovirens]
MGLTVPHFAAERLVPAYDAPRRARRFTRRTLNSWGEKAGVCDIVAVASELVTNAVRHAFRSTPSDAATWLALSATPHSVLCSVTDPSTTPPELMAATPWAANGRGLHVIEALSDDWGYALLANGPGKIVWARVPSRAPLAGQVHPAHPRGVSTDGGRSSRARRSSAAADSMGPVAPW